MENKCENNLSRCYVKPDKLAKMYHNLSNCLKCEKCGEHVKRQVLDNGT